MATPSEPEKSLPWGVAAVSAVQLAAEILFVKLGRYQFGSLSFGLIGIAMLGVALAGLLTTVLGGGRRALGRAALGLPLALLVAGCVLFALPHRFLGGGRELLLLLGAALACLIPLALAAVPVYAAIELAPQRVQRIYAASLAGATCGVVACFALMHAAGDFAAFVACIAACAPAAAWLCPRPSGLRRAALSCSVLAAVGGAASLPAIDGAAHPGRAFSRSNAFSRIDVYRRSYGALQFRTAGINGGTTGIAGPVRGHVPPAGFALAALHGRLGAERALLLGTGAGRDVVYALGGGARAVVAVEINGMIAQYMRAALPAGHDPYRQPGVRLIVGEGREIAARLQARGERFDLVHVPIATLFGSSGHVFTETYLMTREAFALYLRLLRPGGALGVYSPGEIRPKVAAAMAAALRAHGAADPAARMLSVQHAGRFALFARPDRGFSAAETAALQRGDPRLAPRDVRRDIERGRRGRPLTDDNPFLYNDMWSARGVRSVFGWNVRFMHLGYAVCLALLLLVVAAGGRRAARGERIARSAALTAFATMGAAYAVYQTGLIQRFGFLIGHPLLSTAVVLAATLLASAFGAQRSARIAQHRTITTLALAALILGTALSPPSLFVQPAWSAAARAATAAALSLPPFVVMGSFFPVVLARTAGRDPGALPFCWLANGVGAVLGSIAVIYGSMFLGFGAMLSTAAAAYLALGLWDRAQAGERAAAAGRSDRVFLAIAHAALLCSMIALETHVRALR